MVLLPESVGGLNIKDSSLTNNALGVKILQRMIVGTPNWWMIILHKKYFGRNRLRYLQKHKKKYKGTTIQKLCKLVNEIIKEDLYLIQGNGRKVILWEDKILQERLLEAREYLRALKTWMQIHNLLYLSDICECEDSKEDLQLGSKELDLPPNLSGLYETLQLLLRNMNPSNKHSNDVRVWGKKGNDTVQEGYVQQILKKSRPPGQLLERSMEKRRCPQGQLLLLDSGLW